MRRAAFLSAAAAVLAVGPRGPASAQRLLRFELHGAYYSRRLGIVPAVDPQVFVADPTVTVGGIGLENIEHAAGLRALRLDEPDVALYAADGVLLGFTSAKWLEAEGTAAVVPSAGGERLALRFERLIAFGVYSVFKRIPGASGDVDVPVDGTGKSNSFRAGARGEADVAIESPQPLDPQNSLYLVYHSDGRAHGLDPGSLGITAHQHLVAAKV